MCSNVFEEVEERFAHPSVRVHHERDELLMHRRSHSFVLVVLIGLANPEWVTVGDRVSLAGLRLACVVGCVAHDVGDGDVCEDCDAGVSQAVDSDVWAQVVGVAVPVRGAWYLADGLGERGQAAFLADRLDGELYLVVCFVLAASCVAGVDADQVVESVTGCEGRVRRVAAVRETLVVVRVGEAGHGEVEFLSDAHLAEVRGDLEPRFEGADAVPCHCVGAREGVHGGRCFGGCVLEESLVPALVFQV